METVPVLVLQKPAENNAVSTNSDQVHHDVIAQPEMKQAPETVETQGFELSQLSYEMKQAYRVYVELLSDSNRNVAWPFLEPVDAKAQGLWDYHERIKEPMSFAKIGSKFNDCMYNSITEVVSDLRLMLENCYRYNGPEHWVSKLGQKLEKVLEQKLALLNRSLREKVTLTATMALRLNCDMDTLNEGLGRRRSARSYVNMLNGESSSSLISHLKIQEEFEERERRRLKEKEKKEANEALLQELAEWEVKELTPDIIKQLHSMWEVPSVVGLLYILKDILDLQDISLTEIEISFVYPNKSQLLAKVFTALLLTPHQRKSLNKKPPMIFKVWESKLRDRVGAWYKVLEIEGPEMAAYRFGLDPEFYNILGECNPLAEKSYFQLSLHRRVWLLKCLCDNSLYKDYDIREQLNAVASMDQRELVLGYDADNWSYLYFPIFDSTDLRVYRQCPLPNPPFSDKKWKVSPPPASPSSAKVKKTPSRPATPTQPPRNPRLRKLRRSPSPDPESSPPQEKQEQQEEEEMEVEEKCTIAAGFEVACYDVESLRALCQKFEEQAPPPKKRGRKPKTPPGRKRCEVELQQALDALLEDMEQHDARFIKAASKAKAKVMKESLEPDPTDEPEEKPPSEEEEDWVSEGSVEEIPIDTSDEEFVLEEDEVKEPAAKVKKPLPHETAQDEPSVADNSLSRKRNLEVVPQTAQRAAKTPAAEEESLCNIAIQTPPLKLKKKHKSPTSGLSTVSTVNAQGSSAMAKLGTAVPPALNTGAVFGATTASQAAKPLQVRMAAELGLPKAGVVGLESGSATASPSPTVVLKGAVPANAPQTLVVAPGSVTNLKPLSNPQVKVAAGLNLPKAGVVGLVSGSATASPAPAVALKRTAPANTPQTVVVVPGSSSTTAATVKVVSYALGVNQKTGGSPSTTSVSPSIISLPSSVFNQRALQGSTTQVVIGGKVIRAVAVRGSSIAPGQHVTHVLTASPSGAQVPSDKASSTGAPATRPVLVPKTRPLILATSRGRQTSTMQLVRPATVAASVSSNVVVSSATPSHAQASAAVLKNVSVAVSRPAVQTALCHSAGSAPLRLPVGVTVPKAGLNTALPSSVPLTSQVRVSVGAHVMQPAASPPAPSLTNQPAPEVSKDNVTTIVSSSVPSTSQAKLPVRRDVPASRPISSSPTNQLTPKLSKAGVAAVLLTSAPSTSQAKRPVAASMPTSGPLSSSLTSQPTPNVSKPGVAAVLSSSLPSTSKAKTPGPVSSSTLTNNSTVKQVLSPSTTGSALFMPPPTATARESLLNLQSSRPAVVKVTAPTTSGAQVGFISSSSPLPSSGTTLPIPKQTSSRSFTESAVSITPSLVSSGTQVDCVSSSKCLLSSSQPIPKQASCPVDVVSTASVAPCGPTSSGILASTAVSSPALNNSVISVEVTDSGRPQSNYPVVPAVAPSLIKTTDLGQSVVKTGIVNEATVTASDSGRFDHVARSGSLNPTPAVSEVQGSSSTVSSLQGTDCTGQSPLSSMQSNTSKLSSGSTAQLNQAMENESGQVTFKDSSQSTVCETKATDSCSLPSILSGQDCEKKSTDDERDDVPVEQVTITSTTEKNDVCTVSDTTSKVKVAAAEVILQNDESFNLTCATGNLPTVALEAKHAVTGSVVHECSRVDGTLKAAPAEAEGPKVSLAKKDSSSANAASVNMTAGDFVNICNGVKEDNEQTAFIQKGVTQADQDKVACNGSSTVP